jgi:hypothetical protein
MTPALWTALGVAVAALLVCFGLVAAAVRLGTQADKAMKENINANL